MSDDGVSLFAQSPYPGLRPFSADETEIFFGREEQTDDLLDRLQGSRFLAIVGPSGCGKSSLVRAGMIAALNTGLMASAGSHWRVAQMRPGDKPMWNLASALGGADALDIERSSGPTGIAFTDATLRRGPLGLVELLQEGWLPPGANLLLLVDQFEELFRFQLQGGNDEANAFVALLLATAAQSDFPVYVVLTMRTNSLGKCAIFSGLPEAINRGQYLTPRMSREQIKRAIEGPAAVFDADIEDALVIRLLNQIGTDPDQLPLLQHALMRMWQCVGVREDASGEKPARRMITMSDYETVGEIAKALSNHGDEVCASLPGLGNVIERVFRALTERTSDGVENRRPLAFERLCAVTGCKSSEVAQVVERFRRSDTAFLMPPPDVALAGNPVIDISHESLIRQWEGLRAWTQSEADARAEVLRLEDAASRYLENDGELWRGRSLERALEWQESQQPTAPWMGLYVVGDAVTELEKIQTFLGQCKQASDVERRRRRTLHLGMLGLGSIIVIGSLLAAIHLFKLQELAKSREIANRALLDVDPARSAHLALAAVSKDSGNEKAEFALRQSLAALEIAHAEQIVVLGEPIADMRFTNDKSKLVVASGKQVFILDATTFERTRAPLLREKPILNAWLIANKHLVVTLTEDGQGQTQALDGGSVQTLSCHGSENPIYTLAVSTDERRIAAGCRDGELAVWDIGDTVQTQPSLIQGGDDKAPVTALGYSSDSEYLASGDTAGKVTIWKQGVSGPWIGGGAKSLKDSPIHHNFNKAIRDLGFFPGDASLLATASDDGTAIVWKLDMAGRRLAPDSPGSRSKWTLMHERPVVKSRFTPRKDAYLLMTIADKRAYFWQDEKTRDVRRHNDWVTDTGVSDDGEMTVAASNDGTASVWRTRSKSPIAVLRGHRNTVTRALFGASGQIITASLDGSLRVWRLRPPSLLAATGRRWMLSAAFDPAGGRVALCGENPKDTGNQCRIVEQGVASPNQLGEQKFMDPVDADGIALISWSADGRLLMGNAQQQDITGQINPILWDADSGRDITPKWLRHWRWAVFSTGAKELLTVKQDGGIALWDPSALRDVDPKPRLQIPAKPDHAWWWAELSPTGRWIAAIEGAKVALLDSANPEAAPRMLGGHRDDEGHRGDIRNTKFSRDGKWLVTASTDRTARVWAVDQQSGQPEFVELAGGHEAALSFADFNSDASQVVTSSADGTIRVWNATTGHELAVLRWHSDAVNEVHFGADGKSILSASDDGTVLLGRCDACVESLAQLQERVRTEAILAPKDLEKIESDSEATMSVFRLPAFLLSK